MSLSKKIARLFLLAARYTKNPRAFQVKRLGGTPETFWKLDQPWFHALGERQGYEYQVLSGGDRTMAGAAMIILAASLALFYEGQRLFDDVYELRRQQGFDLRDSFNMIYDPHTDLPLQGDFTFLRPMRATTD